MSNIESFWGRAGGTHQFRVEFLRRPPPVHGHQGLCGCGDAVAIEVELALSFGIGARASLGAGGNEAAGPRIHLPMQRGTRHWKGLGSSQPFSVLYRQHKHCHVSRCFLLCKETAGGQQASVLVGLDRCVGHRPQSSILKIGFCHILAAFLQQTGWPFVSLISMQGKHAMVESAAYGTVSLTSCLVSGASNAHLSSYKAGRQGQGCHSWGHHLYNML